MIYIGFSKYSCKTLARIFCINYKHCAPIIIKRNKCFLYQFTNKNNICIICLHKQDLKRLEQYGWKFVMYNKENNLPYALYSKSSTCVQFTKKFCNIKNKKIQTPDNLLKYILQK